jgi:hypothetical protein
METYANGLRDAGVNNLTTAEVPDAGHFTTEEQPAQVWQIIDEFARGVGTRWQPPDLSQTDDTRNGSMAGIIRRHRPRPVTVVRCGPPGRIADGVLRHSGAG